jgi:hypothetical protein
VNVECEVGVPLLDGENFCFSGFAVLVMYQHASRVTDIAF